MISSKILKEVVSEARPIIERQFDNYRMLNGIFMHAWRDGILDHLWDEYRANDKRAWLIYFIRARGMGDIKIGKSNHVRTRFLSLATAAARGLDLVACYPAPISHEKELHAEFEHLRLCGEWFRAGSELLDHLKLVGSDVNNFTNAVPAHFYTLTPERMQ